MHTDQPTRPTLAALCAVALLAPLGASQIVFAEPRDIVMGDQNEIVLGVADGDIDGNGLPEMVAFLFWEPAVACVNAGDGVFTPTSLGPNPGGTHWRLVDLDGDGALDLLSKHNGHMIACAFGDGAGDFGPHVVVHDEPWTGPDQGNPIGLLVADVTGDGITDIVATNKHGFFDGTASTHLYVGMGGGDLASAVTLGEGFSWSLHEPESGWTMAVDDVDRDGTADVLAFARPVLPPSEESVTVAVAYQAVGSSAPTTTTTPLGGAFVAGVFLDADGDGLLDVLVESEGVGRLHRATGHGSFDPPMTAYTAGSCTTSEGLRLVGHDLDGDGRDDLVRVCDGAGEIWRSEAGGGYTRQDGLPELPFPQKVHVVEFDGDGRPDLVTAYLGDTPSWGLRIATNLTYPPSAPFQDLGGGLPSDQHLMLQIAEGTMEPGTPLTIRASGVDPAGSAWLVVGLEHTPAVFAGGVLGPSPDALHGPVSASGQTSASWHGTWPERTPSGSRAFAQAWVLESDGRWSATTTVALVTP